MTARTDTVLASWEKTATSIIKKLSLHNIEGHWARTSDDAVELVRSWMAEGDSVTWGGSETFKECGMKATLAADGGFRMLDRADAATPDEQRAMWQARTTADWFFMSANAITLGGELVNIDGNSDRCSLLLHGPEHVVVLVGMNKVVTDVDAAVKRIRTMACPLNGERLNSETPCAVTGVCTACHAPKCMCCNIVVTRHSRHTGRIRVILIGEELGY